MPVRLTVTTVDEAGKYVHRTLDATPWLERASKRELAELRREREGGATDSFYGGERTDDIFGWLAENHPTPESREILRICDDSGASWVADLNGEDFRRWDLRRKSVEVANQAVDHLLGQRYNVRRR